MASKKDCRTKKRKGINMSTAGKPLLVKQERDRSLHRQEGGEHLRKLKNLNRQFERDIYRLESSVMDLDVGDRSLASIWIHKLKTRPPGLTEAVARNYILSHMLQLGPFKIFKKVPFSKPPTNNSLSQIKLDVPLSTPSTKINRNIEELYRNSSDNGAFLNKLPVPRNGAFFVLHLRPNFNSM